VGNTVGSLSKVQKSLITGSLLGDGYMRCKTNAHLQVTHSIEQKLYVDWKYVHLRDYVITPPKTYKGNGKRVGYRFFTRSLTQFTRFYRHHYVKGVKISPEDLYLDPFTLAVWFMDDGSKSRRSLYLNTQQFKNKEQLLLKRVLKRDLGLEAKLDRDKEYYRLRFVLSESLRLVGLIKTLVIPSLQYKLLI
jgi:hypothetical protein